MKTKILLGAGALVLSATTLGVSTALFVKSPELLVRFTTVASILGTGSIGLFFVGLAFPKEQLVTVKRNK